MTWNSKDEVSRCLESLEQLASPTVRFETVIVDNGSEDGTQKFLQESGLRFKGIGLKVINNSRNVGLSEATEQGYQNATGDLILLCNPDIEFNESVRTLLSYGLSHPQEIITGEMVNADGSLQRTVHRRFPTITRVFFEFGAVGSYIDEKLLNYAVHKSYAYEGEKFPPAVLIEQPGASFLLFGRHVVNQIGFVFDSQFPVWWNDVDLARRAEKASITRILLSEVRVKHGLGHSHKNMPTERQRHMFFRGMILYARKWKMHPFLLQVLFSIDAVLGVFLLSAVQGQTRGPVQAIKRSVSIAAAQMAGILGAGTARAAESKQFGSN